jgi:L-2-amino-thiazoline-4-carboxylic acid hydrolase-like protein
MLRNPVRTNFGSVYANWLAANFFRSLKQTTVELRAAREGVTDNIKREAQALFDGQRTSLPDRRARLILTLCSLILASYRELLILTGEPKRSEEIVGKTLFITNQGLAKLMTLSVTLARQPLKVLSRSPLQRISELTYGKSMGFSQEKTDGSVTLVVNRCAFHQFFVDHGEPQLTKLLCMWDRNWMDPINWSDRPVRIERPSTISTGSEVCRFRFVRDGLKENKETVDILPASQGH